MGIVPFSLSCTQNIGNYEVFFLSLAFHNECLPKTKTTISKQCLAYTQDEIIPMNTSYIVSESDGSVMFTVQRNGSSIQFLQGRTENGTAIAVEDYLAKDFNFSFPESGDVVMFNVTIVDDQVPEPTECFMVNFDTPPGGSVTSNITVCIKDDDDPCTCPSCDQDLCKNGGTCMNNGMGMANCMCSQYWRGATCEEPYPVFRLSPSRLSVDENVGSVMMNVTRFGPFLNTSVSLQTVARSAGTGDFEPLTNLRVTFQGDDPEVTVSFEVVIKEDEIAERTEHFLVQMADPSSGLVESAAVISIIDNDDPCTCPTCNPEPCKNGGTCSDGGEGRASCACTGDWTGATCEGPGPCILQIDSCTQECIGIAGTSFKCGCYRGFTLQNDNITCTADTPCGSSCSNGSCIRRQSADVCVCDRGYRLSADDQTQCDDIDECFELTDYCDDNSRCRNTAGSYECDCDEAYVLNADQRSCTVDRGSQCETVGGFRCSCTVACDVFTGQCTSACSCRLGFGGPACMTEINCGAGTPTSVCQNGGTCTVIPPASQGNRYCRCLPGFTGKVCEITCPGDVQEYEDANSPGRARVVWAPELFGNHSNTGVVTQSNYICRNQNGIRVMSSSWYPVGETSISCEPNRTTTRARGTCEFSVTVLPEITYYFGNLSAVSEDEGHLLVTIIRSGAAEPINTTVVFSTQELTANSSDFDILAGIRVAFIGDESVTSFNVSISDDELIEETECFLLTLTNPSFGRVTSNATVCIEDNDGTMPSTDGLTTTATTAAPDGGGNSTVGDGGSSVSGTIGGGGNGSTEATDSSIDDSMTSQGTTPSNDRQTIQDTGLRTDSPTVATTEGTTSSDDRRTTPEVDSRTNLPPAATTEGTSSDGRLTTREVDSRTNLPPVATTEATPAPMTPQRPVVSTPGPSHPTVSPTGNKITTTQLVVDLSTNPPAEGCSLVSGSCQQGVLDADHCECVCPLTLFGQFCQVSNPCLDGSLCPVDSQYCVASTQSSTGHTCVCNALGGYITDQNGFCFRRVVRVFRLRVFGVNGVAIDFTLIYINPTSTASQEVLTVSSKVLLFILRRNVLTSTVVDIQGIRIVSGGSAIIEFVGFFPDENSAPSVTTIQSVLQASSMLDDGSDNLEVDTQYVTDSQSSSSCPQDYCRNGGTCDVSGLYPVFTFTCRCATSFTGGQCESVIPLTATDDVPSPQSTTPAPDSEDLTMLILVLVFTGLLILVVIVGILVCFNIVQRRRYQAGHFFQPDTPSDSYWAWRNGAIPVFPATVMHDYDPLGYYDYGDSNKMRSYGRNEERRMRRLHQVMSHSPYLQQGIGEFPSKRRGLYMATGREAFYREDSRDGGVAGRVVRNPVPYQERH
ncbi:uncharacterized protein LOC110976360 [Acanthaster planci]|uniref:Uncharacterized protein LOC110976360 n=1 Tax=Acanthaster planci TaxID=133434 RepID=A0A8B7XWJ7_ACAPL|nr:uncharacterized protein LOC110976360 [Acanthaster planci]